jgi:hypothetical protein
MASRVTLTVEGDYALNEKVSYFKDLAFTAIVSATISGLYNRVVGYMQGKDAILGRLPTDEARVLEDKLREEAAESIDTLTMFAD